MQAMANVQAQGANPQQFVSGDLEAVAVNSDGFRDVAWVQGDKTNGYAAGFGPKDRQANMNGFSDLDVVASGNGTGAAGDNIQGKGRFIVYKDSNRENPIGRTGTFPLNRLRGAVSESTTDKVIIHGQHGKIAGMDAYLALQIKADPGSDGTEIDPAASAHDEGIAYAEVEL